MQVSDKKQLRAHFRQLRRSMDDSSKVGYDNSTAERFLNSEFYKQCDELLIYVSFDIEVGTLDIISTALNEKTVYCPRCVAGTNIMEFYRVKGFNDLSEGSYGILEPCTGEAPVESFGKNALCVVPGLSFDEKGYRLGFGKGYYDRFLSEFDSISVGLCYESCLSEALPTDKFDICVDHLITENRCFSFGVRKEEIYG